MDRITDKQITARVARLQKEGMNVEVDGQYGQYRIVTKDGSRNLSPRAPNRQIMDWLDAYEYGWNEGVAHFKSTLPTGRPTGAGYND